MCEIFTSTTSLLSNDFVASFPAEKLALTLFKIGQETGVEFNKQKKSFSITGHWDALVKARKTLEQLLFDDAELRNSSWNLDDSGEVQDEDDDANVDDFEFEATPKPKRSRKKKGGGNGKPGRKPYSNSAIPDPVVLYQFNKSRVMDQDLLKTSTLLNVFESGSQAALDQELEKLTQAITKHDEAPRTNENTTTTVSDGKVESSKDLSGAFPEVHEHTNNGGNDVVVNKDENQVNDTQKKDNISVKNEVDEDGATDIDESYLLDESTEKDSKSLDTTKDSNDTEIRVKVENVEEKEEEEPSPNPPKRKSKRKSIPVKLVQCESLDDILEKTKKTRNKKTPRKLPKPKPPPKPKKPKKGKEKEEEEEDETKEFKCELCNYIGHSRFNFKEHLKRKHRHTFTCDVCQKQFGRNKDLTRHKSQVHAEPTHFCDICQKFYKTKKVYEEHVLSHNENYVKPSFACKLCTKSFSSKYVLANHIKADHLGLKKSFVCPTCGRSFTQKNTYIMHANVHAGIKPYVCDICGKAFTYDKSLREHKYMHDSQRRFKCPVCQKTFRQTTSLRIHMKIHKDGKDYMCTSCGKGFTQKQALLRHERIHSGEKPYVCSLCGRAFSDYSIIRRHMMMIHKKESRDWRQDIISNVKKKENYYIEGGPGHHKRDINTTPKVAATTAPTETTPTATTSSGMDYEMDPSAVAATTAAKQGSGMRITDVVESATEMMNKAMRGYPATGIEQMSDQGDNSCQSGIQDLSQNNMTWFPPIQQAHSGSVSPAMQPHVTGGGNPRSSTVVHSSNSHPINYSRTSIYATGNMNPLQQTEIPDASLSDVPGLFPDAHRNVQRQWYSTPPSMPPVSTSSSLPQQMRGQFAVPPVPGLPADSAHTQLIHAWAYSGYAPWNGSPNIAQYPPNSQN